MADWDDEERVRPRRPRDDYDERPPRRGDSDDERRPRRRYDDEDAPPRQGGHGFWIGVIVGSGGVLLIGGLIALVILLSGGLKNKIVGTWKDDNGFTYEFTAGDVLTVHTPANLKFSATYKLDGEILELSGDDPLDKKKRLTDRQRAEISGDELILSYGPQAKSPPLKLKRLR
jgi:hypothetical protein